MTGRIDGIRSALVAAERQRSQGAIRNGVDRATRKEAAGEPGHLRLVVDAQRPLQRDRRAHAAAFEPGAGRTDADQVATLADRGDLVARKNADYFAARAVVELGYALAVDEPDQRDQ